MIDRLREIDALRRTAATQCEQWHSVGKEVYDENGVGVCETDTNARAAYIAQLHNQILPICAMLFQACKKQVDRMRIREEQDAG